MSGYMTDLAMESEKLSGGTELPGVRVRRDALGNVTRVRVDVLDELGVHHTGRRMGTYTTLYSDALDDGGSERDALRDLLIAELKPHLPPEDAPGGVLVLGLGNRQVTPDALGPRTADMVLGTRALLDGAGMRGMRQVMTVAPGVYGSTGVDAGELALAIVRQLHPELIIAVDALCARDFERIATTVQLSDSGIQPGSGVGNHRTELSRDTLGIPVIAIGVPTVVYAATLARDALERAGMRAEPGHNSALNASLDSLIVTPRQIDSLTERSAHLLAAAINIALNPALTEQELMRLTI